MRIHAECVRLLYYSMDSNVLQLDVILSSSSFSSSFFISFWCCSSDNAHTETFVSCMEINRRPYWLRNGVCIWSIHFNGFEPNTFISFYCICAFWVFLLLLEFSNTFQATLNWNEMYFIFVNPYSDIDIFCSRIFCKNRKQNVFFTSTWLCSFFSICHKKMVHFLTVQGWFSGPQWLPGLDIDFLDFDLVHLIYCLKIFSVCFKFQICISLPPLSGFYHWFIANTSLQSLVEFGHQIDVQKSFSMRVAY